MMDVEINYDPEKKEGVKIKINNRTEFKRNNSTRGSKKKLENGVKAMQISNANIGLKVALIIINGDYNKSDYSTLNGVVEDGKKMKEMLWRYDDVVLLNDVTDIAEAVSDFYKRQRATFKTIERLHFHYSGHGVENANIEIDPHACTVEEDRITYHSLTPSGGCMVGCSGELYSVHDLKQELLKCSPQTFTLTLDCCRSTGQSTGQKRGKDHHKQYVSLRNMTAISDEDQIKIATIHGTSDLHPANDSDSFTKELYSVYVSEKHEIEILKIVSKVNESWMNRGIRQYCKLDFLDVGINWKFYVWPNPNPFKPHVESIADTNETKESGKSAIGTEELERMFKAMKMENEERLKAMKMENEKGLKALENKIEEKDQRLKKLEEDRAPPRKRPRKATRNL